ncbi:oligosaccharide flippase family protein [Aestuariicella hydrocarbonica]|uniref:Oligosaccharide flippase family protein n=1 Tax=Pseudomaricurvus hydrocarbonicus TaxID=1470433 RepID=A0A9E5MJ82_9GAMM|nr:oligosaccharide flippase family protein [Aestuariicella hydrocarbonica]NHO64674.1 oligosaccharide flippase family protein [Aestuariicella hydrocarbonica]
MAVRKNLSMMGLAHFIAFVLNFASVIVVSRLLTPEEIGIYSVSVAILGLAHIFRDFGVGQYLVQAQTVGKTEFRAALSITLYASWLIALVLFLVREPLATLYQHDGVSQVLGILCINFIVLPFGTPLLSMMQRELQFHFLALNLGLSTLVQTSVTIACAYAGQSFLSMAWGALAAHLAKLVWLNIMRPGEIFIWPTLRGLKSTLHFGSLASLASIIREVGTSSSDLILGRTLGFSEVAFLSRANGLNKMLLTRVVALVRGVYFPTFANELRNGADGAKLYSRSMCYLVAITGPALAVMAITSEPLILFLFGEQWQRSVPLAMLICFYAMLVTPYSLYSLSLVAAGHVKRNLWVEVIIQTVQVLVLLSSIWWPLERVVMLLGLVALTQIACAQSALKKTFGLTMAAHLKSLAPSLLLIPFSASGPAILMYLAQSHGFSEQRLLILLLSGALAVSGWAIGIFVTRHPMRTEVMHGLSTLKSKYKPC